MLVAENENMKLERERVVNECYPPLKLSGLSVQELQVTNTANHANSAIIISHQLDTFSFPLQDLCKDLLGKMDVVDETRYDMEFKVARNEIEVN